MKKPVDNLSIGFFFVEKTLVIEGLLQNPQNGEVKALSVSVP